MDETTDMITFVIKFPPIPRGTKWPRRVKELLDTMLTADDEGCEVIAVGVGNHMLDPVEEF